MTTDRWPPDADPADVAEQQQDAAPPRDDRDLPATDEGDGDLPWSADEADVAEQRREVPGDDFDEG
jgi:hypothetical protein